MGTKTCVAYLATAHGHTSRPLPYLTHTLYTPPRTEYTPSHNTRAGANAQESKKADTATSTRKSRREERVVKKEQLAAVEAAKVADVGEEEFRGIVEHEFRTFGTPFDTPKKQKMSPKSPKDTAPHASPSASAQRGEGGGVETHASDGEDLERPGSVRAETSCVNPHISPCSQLCPHASSPPPAPPPPPPSPVSHCSPDAGEVTDEPPKFTAKHCNFVQMCKTSMIFSAPVLLKYSYVPEEEYTGLQGVLLEGMEKDGLDMVKTLMVRYYYGGREPALGALQDELAQLGASADFVRDQAEAMARLNKIIKDGADRAARENKRAELADSALRAPPPPPARPLLPPTAEVTPVGTRARPAIPAPGAGNHDVIVVDDGPVGEGAVPVRFTVVASDFGDALGRSLARPYNELEPGEEEMVVRIHPMCSAMKVPPRYMGYMPRAAPKLGLHCRTTSGRVEWLLVCMHHQNELGPNYTAPGKTDAYHFCWKEKGTQQNPTEWPEECIGIREWHPSILPPPPRCSLKHTPTTLIQSRTTRCSTFSRTWTPSTSRASA